MEVSNYEKSLRDNLFKKPLAKVSKKLLVKRPSGAKPNPAVIVVDGKIMAKSGSTTGDATPGKVPVSKSVQPAGKGATGAALQKAKKAKKKGLFKKIGRSVLGVATGGASLAITKKGRATLKKGAKKVAKTAGKVVQASLLAPLLPLKPVMAKALKKKGFPAPKKTADLAEAFYNNIVAKNHFDSQFHGNEKHYDGYNDEHITGDIVMGILQFVKSLLNKKKQKKAGAPVALSPVEELIANDAGGVVREIEQKAGDAGVSLAPELPGSNAKESNEGGGIQPPDPDDMPTNGTGNDPIRKKKGGKKDGGISLGGNTPLLIGGAALLAYLAFKNS